MKSFISKALLLCAVNLVALVSFSHGQWVYGSSQLGYDQVTGEVFSYSRTWVDAYVGLDHDPEVDGFLYQVGQQVDSGTDTGWAHYFGAEVDLETPSLPSTQYTVISDHWIKRVTYTDVIIVGEEYTFWWDPWGFSTFSPVYGNGYPGFPYNQWVGPQWSYLGWTAVSGITPPDDPCETPALAPEDGILSFEGPDGLAACQTPTPNPTVSGQITSVGFTGSGKHDVYRYGAGPAPPAAPTLISNPTWVQGTGSGDNKVAYTKGTGGMTLQGTLTLSPAVPSGTSLPAKVRVKKGSSTVISEVKSVSLTGSSVTVNDIAINTTDLESTSKVRRADYNFRWEISFDDGANWRSAGDSGPHPVYWTWATPLANKFRNVDGDTDNHLFDLALEKATAALGSGGSDERNIVKIITTSIDTDIIYNPAEDDTNSTHPLAAYFFGNAQCSGNANLLSGILRSIGIDANTYYYFGGDRVTDTAHFYAYTIRRHPTSGAPIYEYPSLQAKRETSREGTPAILSGNVKKDPHFTFHAMTRVSTLADKRYDPSYGKEYEGRNFVAKEVADFTSTVPAFKFDSATVNNIIEKTTLPAFEITRTAWICSHRGLSGFVARNVPSFDDDEVADLGVWRPSNGVWHMLNSTDGSASFTAFGLSGDRLTAGDFDGDGYGDHAIFRPSENNWYILRSSDGNMDLITFGMSNDQPVQGDYDSDGKTDIAIWRPSDGTWHILGSIAGYTVAQFGMNGDKPLFGDFDGDAKTDLAVWRPSNGAWYIWNSGSGTFTITQFGSIGPDVVPAVGDYDNDGKTDLASWNGDDGVWHVKPSGGTTPWATTFGNKSFGDKAVPGDYDGDGKTDVAVWRSSNGQWWILRSSDHAAVAHQWGESNDRPIHLR